MEHNWLLYIATFACAFAVALVFAPQAKTIALRLGAIDYPKERGLHKEPIPRMGGLTIVLGFMASMAVACWFVPELRTRSFVGFIIGALIIVALGMLDDIYNLRARYKLVVQIIAALVAVLTGTRIDFVNWPFPAVFSEVLSIPFTMVWIVGLTNAVNLIDGVDGLAAGVTSISSLCLMALCIMSGSPIAVVYTSALAGACLGFLPRNLNPAEMIMGDTGSTFLGYVLAVSSIMGVYKSYALLSVVIAMLALALPIFDTAFAMLRRFINHKPIMGADRGHLHHRLIDKGYSQKQTVVILYGISGLSGVAAIVIAIRDIRVIVAGVLMLLVLFMIMFVYRRRTATVTEPEIEPCDNIECTKDTDQSEDSKIS